MEAPPPAPPAIETAPPIACDVIFALLSSVPSVAWNFTAPPFSVVIDAPLAYASTVFLMVFVDQAPDPVTATPPPAPPAPATAPANENASIVGSEVAMISTASAALTVEPSTYA